MQSMALLVSNILFLWLSIGRLFPYLFEVINCSVFTHHVVIYLKSPTVIFLLFMLTKFCLTYQTLLFMVEYR